MAGIRGKMVNFGPQTPKKYPPNLKNGHRGAKFPFSECQNYTDKSISQIPPGGTKTGGGYVVKTSRPGDGDHLRGGTDNLNNVNEKRTKSNKNHKYHILCRIHCGSLLGGFLI